MIGSCEMASHYRMAEWQKLIVDRLIGEFVHRWTAPLIRSSRSEDSPTDSGLAAKNPGQTQHGLRVESRADRKNPFLPGDNMQTHPSSELYDLIVFEACVPSHGLLAEVRFVRHVARDRRIVCRTLHLQSPALRDFTDWKNTFKCGRMSSQSCPL